MNSAGLTHMKEHKTGRHKIYNLNLISFQTSRANYAIKDALSQIAREKSEIFRIPNQRS